MPNDIKKLRRLMRTANYIRKEHPANGNMAFALRNAWWFEAFREALSNGFARFTYKKIDGTTRTALGTRSPLLIPAEHHPSSGAPNKNSESLSSGARSKNSEFATIPYFDLDINEWRSFSVLNFVSLDNSWKFNDPGTSSRQTGGVASAEKG